MQRLGPIPSKMRNLKEKDVLRSRLQLMVVMVKAYLNNYQLGGHRTAAIEKNARMLSEGISDWESYTNNFCEHDKGHTDTHLDHILFQRVKLLSIMAKSLAGGNPMGFHRKMALKNNIDYICESLNIENRSNRLPLLSVA